MPFWLRLVVVVAFASSSVDAQAQVGQIAGRVSDPAHAQLPGVTLRISGGGRVRETVTDPDGRFRFEALAPGTYRVVAELPGFRPEAGDVTLTEATPRAYLAWSLELGCLTHVLRVLDARGLAPSADAVVHARVTGTAGATLMSVDAFCEGSVVQEYGVEVVGGFRVRGARLSASQQVFMESDAPTLELGYEYIILLWHDSPVAPELVFPVVDGRVRAPTVRELDGQTPARALKVLERWSKKPHGA